MTVSSALKGSQEFQCPMCFNLGAVHKVCHAFWGFFRPPPPCHTPSQFLEPPLKKYVTKWRTPPHKVDKKLNSNLYLTANLTVILTGILKMSYSAYFFILEQLLSLRESF